MLTKLKGFVSEILNLSLGIRLTVGVLLGAIGSSSVIGFLTEYAAVSYALAYGVRIPTEGVPYLRYAATGISFALFILAFGSFFVTYAVLRLLLKAAIAHTPEKHDVSALPLGKYLLVFAPSALVVTQPLLGALTLAAGHKLLPEAAAISVVLVVFVSLLVFGRRPQWLTWFTLISYVAGTVAIVASLFTPNIYAELLNYIRFGGGVPIEIVRNCKDISPCTPTSQGHLFLRTQDYFLLINASDKRITEIPMASIVEYKYLGANRWAGK